jgi:hypothetical protein
VHEDVRTAAIRKSVVGNLVPQEERRREYPERSGFKFRIAQDESQGRSQLISHGTGCCAACVSRDSPTSYLVSTEKNLKSVEECYL